MPVFVLPESVVRIFGADGNGPFSILLRPVNGKAGSPLQPSSGKVMIGAPCQPAPTRKRHLAVQGIAFFSYFVLSYF